MSKWFCEVVKDFNGLYYANMSIDGKPVEDLPEYVNYSTLKAAIKEKTGKEIPPLNQMIFEKVGRKKYALIDCTQTRPDCRVTMRERLWGWSPAFDKSYTIKFTAEDTDYATVKMTEQEAKIVKCVLEDADKQITSRRCGRVELVVL